MDTMKITPIGYQGAAQHSWTAACDGFHEAGPCPEPKTQVVLVGTLT